MNQKNEKGITLIALVITIIVLLILAGVTINMVLGDEGIIQNAKQAKEQHTERTIDEEIELINLTHRTNKLADKNYADTKTITAAVTAAGYTIVEGKITFPTGEKFLVDTDNDKLVKLIDFSIATYSGDDVEKCEAEEGMTWEEWIDSEYNNDKLLEIVDGQFIYMSGTDDAICYNVIENSGILGDCEWVDFEDKIKADFEYLQIYRQKDD